MVPVVCPAAAPPNAQHGLKFGFAQTSGAFVALHVANAQLAALPVYTAHA